MDNAVFSLDGVRFSYKANDVLKNISFTVNAGDSLGIAGASGSGKTTLLSLMLRLSFPRKGSVSFCGKDLSKMTRHEVQDFRKRVQPVFQDPFLSLDPAQRVENIVGEPLTSLKLVSGAEEKRARVISALESVGLDADVLRRFPAEFSGGQRQRISIARALVTAPEALIADEPVSALDVITKTEILALLRSLKANKNFTLIMVSHDIPALAGICSRLIVIDGGEAVCDAALRDALLHPVPAVSKLVESLISLQ
jgi:peptide/nickel transport system ATP-binding protein